MTVSVQVLFGRPQHEIASLLSDRLSRCVSASLVSGFITVDGIEAIGVPIRAAPAKLMRLVVGAGTWRAFDALDGLISAGVSSSALHVHLGHTRPSGTNRNPFHRYHPMLHSKIYLLDMGNGNSAAFVGSHNLTGFALRGLNGEAGVLLEGPTSSPEMTALRDHVNASVAQAVPYDPGMKEAYAWWTMQFIDGLRAEANDTPAESDRTRTIVVIAACKSAKIPGNGKVIYFEMPEAILVQSLQPEVHIYIFATLPPSPAQALAQLSSATARLTCKIEGVEAAGGGVEMRADWFIDNRRSPELKTTSAPFRPNPAPGMQQISVRVQGRIPGRYEYLFDQGRTAWMPVYDDNDAVIAEDLDGKSLPVSYSERTRKELPWQRVRGLERSSDPQLKLIESKELQLALLESAPGSESFVLFSLRRRALHKGRQRK